MKIEANIKAVIMNFQIDCSNFYYRDLLKRLHLLVLAIIRSYNFEKAQKPLFKKQVIELLNWNIMQCQNIFAKLRLKETEQCNNFHNLNFSSKFIRWLQNIQNVLRWTSHLSNIQIKLSEQYTMPKTMQKFNWV